MYPLLETIRLEDGKLMNLDYHEKRMDKSISQLFGNRELPAIREMITISGQHESGIFKCRLLYSNTSFKLRVEAYKKRTINKLIIIENPDIKYDLKYSDRAALERIINPDEKNTEILITQNNYLSDTTYTNIALKKGSEWITPDRPLLEGTQRALLLNEGIIQSGKIRISDLNKYSNIRLFNAMMPWSDCIELDVDQIGINN